MYPTDIYINTPTVRCCKLMLEELFPEMRAIDLDLELAGLVIYFPGPFQ